MTPFGVTKCRSTVWFLRPAVLPVWLHRHAPYAGAVDESLEDDEYSAEQRWLSACVRMLDCGGATPELRHHCRPPITYRNASTWFLIAMDTYLFLKCQRGLEAFSSPSTPAKAMKLQGTSAPKGDEERLTRVCRIPFPFEWCGAHIDTCSVGVCAVNCAKWGLDLYVEGFYDGLHGVHRAIFRALDESDHWHIFLILRLWYTFAWAPWMGGKYLVEMRQYIDELKKLCPKELRKLFQLFLFQV